MGKDTEVRKDCWSISVQGVMINKVYFFEELTKEEALSAYKKGEFDDVFDEDFIEEEILDAE